MNKLKVTALVTAVAVIIYGSAAIAQTNKSEMAVCIGLNREIKAGIDTLSIAFEMIDGLERDYTTMMRDGISKNREKWSNLKKSLDNSREAARDVVRTTNEMMQLRQYMKCPS